MELHVTLQEVKFKGGKLDGEHGEVVKGYNTILTSCKQEYRRTGEVEDGCAIFELATE